MTQVQSPVREDVGRLRVLGAQEVDALGREPMPGRTEGPPATSPSRSSA